MKSCTILLVEDNASDVALTRRALAKGNIPYELVVAEDGQDALDYLFGGKLTPAPDPATLPSLIILDLNLPRVDGFEVLRRVRSDEHTRRVPVVILTTSKEEHDITESYDMGANSYIRKPVDFTQFVQSIGHVALYWLTMNEPSPSKAR